MLPIPIRRCAILVFALLVCGKLGAYSVLTHEAIIDSLWKGEIQPHILRRFPHSTSQTLTHARAYAYGGCIVQDMGYYPLSSKFFSDLVHYVRSGDFVVALLEQARNADEYAFALGALAHYAADNEGHAIAVNRAVPIEYPKLRARFGETVTYADNPRAHMKAEFGFDVLEVARGRYTSEAYHDFIGFEVAQDLLARAFQTTYGIRLEDVFANADVAIGTYRYIVSEILPRATKVAWQLKKEEIARAWPGVTRQQFLYRMSGRGYEKEWDGKYRRPGAGAKVVAFFVRVVPKIGPFRTLSFHAPTPEVERLFEQSFNGTVELYRRLLRSASRRRERLANINLDTGKPVRAGDYSLADKTYARLARRLGDRNPQAVPAALREEILAFYRGGSGGPRAKVDKDWRRTAAALQKLKANP